MSTGRKEFFSLNLLYLRRWSWPANKNLLLSVATSANLEFFFCLLIYWLFLFCFPLLLPNLIPFWSHEEFAGDTGRFLANTLIHSCYSLQLTRTTWLRSWPWTLLVQKSFAKVICVSRLIRLSGFQLGLWLLMHSLLTREWTYLPLEAFTAFGISKMLYGWVLHSTCRAIYSPQ